MGIEARLALIKQLERDRSSRVLCYLTGDRTPDLSTRIAMDVFPLFYEVLIQMGKQDQIDLLIYSTGGLTMAAWGLVNLLREFCDNLSVLVPFKAHSSATLIALGADEIVMSRMGQLSPVDPTVTSPFNPTLPSHAPGQPPNFLPVSVEDVISFIDLVREEAKVKSEQHIAELIKVLAADVRPLALGSVYRAKQQIGMLARKLLDFHMSPSDSTKVDAIVETLTRRLYSHDYLIGRKEAKNNIGLKITDCTNELEHTLMQLFADYSDAMELKIPYNHSVILGGQTTRVVHADRAYIECTELTYVFRSKREIKKVKTMEKGIALEGFQESTIEEGWKVEARRN